MPPANGAILVSICSHVARCFRLMHVNFMSLLLTLKWTTIPSHIKEQDKDITTITDRFSPDRSRTSTLTLLVIQASEHRSEFFHTVLHARIGLFYRIMVQNVMNNGVCPCDPFLDRLQKSVVVNESLFISVTDSIAIIVYNLATDWSRCESSKVSQFIARGKRGS